MLRNHGYSSPKQTTDNVHLKHNLNNFQKAFTIVDKMLMTLNTATEVESEYLPVVQDDSSQLLFIYWDDFRNQSFLLHVIQAGSGDLELHLNTTLEALPWFSTAG